MRFVRMTDAALGEIEGYVALWGSAEERDSYGTWFDREHPPEMGLEYLPLPLTYEHGADRTVGMNPIGSIVRVWFDDDGIRFRALLDQSSPYFGRIVNEVQAQKLATSSGSMAHLVDFDDDGRFVKWTLGEVALTKSPAESRMPTVTLIRSKPAGKRDASGTNAGNDFAMLSTGGNPMTAIPEAQATRALADMVAPGVDPSPENILAAMVAEFGQDNVMQMLQAMLPPTDAPAADAMPEAMSSAARAQLQAMLAQLVRSQQPAPAPATQTSDVFSTMRSALEQMQRSAPPINRQVVTPPSGGSNTRPHITVSEPLKFAHATPGTMALGYMLLEQAARNQGSKRAAPASEQYMRSMAFKLARAIERDDPNDAVAGDAAVRSSFTFKDGRAIRANEIMQSTAVGFGDEWVYDLQGTELWTKIRMETNLYDRMLAMGMDERELPQGFEGESVPLEGADPTWYVAAGAADYGNTATGPTPTYGNSKFGTAKRDIDVAKLSVVLPFQRELEEDSIIDIAAEAQRKIAESGREQMEYILLNGDTTLTADTNINLIDGTPAAAPLRPAYTLLNGLAKLPLVTNTANSRDAGSTLTEIDYLALLPLLGEDGNDADEDRVLFVVDSATYVASQNLAVVKTQDVFPSATVVEGRLRRIWGIEVVKSGQFKRANATGKISATAGNNTRGRILLVRPDRWTSRWKRRLETHVTYYPKADTTEIVGHMRWGIAYFDTEAAAISYNVDTTIS